MADVTLKKDYQTRNRDIFLSVTIGEGQFGTSDVMVDKDQILRASGSIGKLRVGNGKDLAGKTLNVLSVVSDVSTATNRMSVTYKLTGGQTTSEFTARGQVTKAGAFLEFEAIFSLL